MKSTEYKCPRCNTPVNITVDYEEDIQFGFTVSIEVYCPHCNDRRIESIDNANDIVVDLLNRIGT